MKTNKKPEVKMYEVPEMLRTIIIYCDLTKDIVSLHSNLLWEICREGKIDVLEWKKRIEGTWFIMSKEYHILFQGTHEECIASLSYVNRVEKGNIVSAKNVIQDVIDKKIEYPFPEYEAVDILLCNKR